MTENEERRSPVKYEFKDLMPGRERLLILLGLPALSLIVPLFMSAVSPGFLLDAANTMRANLYLYIACLLFALFNSMRFLREGFDILLDEKQRCLLALLMAYLLNIVLNFALQFVLGAFRLDLGVSPNNEYVFNTSGGTFGELFALLVLMAPVVEEMFFRAVVFGGLYKYGRILAYAVSILLFASSHVIQYVLMTGDLSYLLFILVYIPASTALTWSYERSGTIWVPMLLHMLINLIAVLTARALGFVS